MHHQTKITGAIDPGKLGFAWALARDGYVRHCGFAKCALNEVRAHIPEHVHYTIEVPRVYPGKGKGDPNDLIDVALMAGACASVSSSYRQVYPSQWKGSLPKTVSHRRIRQTLGVAELELVKGICEQVGKTLAHNVWDAVGILLWTLKRS